MGLRPEIEQAVRMLLDHSSLVLQDEDVIAGALELFRGRSSLGFSDCVMFELATKAGTFRSACSISDC